MINFFKKVFFNNLGTKQTVFKNTFWLSLSEALSRILNLALLIYVARVLGAGEYGKFTFAISFVSLLAIFSDLGLYEIVTRDFAKHKDSEKDYPSVLSLKIFLTIISFLLMIVGSFFITDDLEIKRVIWILSFFILISSFFNIFYAFYRAREKMEYEAFSVTGQIVLITVFGFFSLLLWPSVVSLSLAYLFANIVALLLICLGFRIFAGKIKIGFDFKIWAKFLKSAWPLAMGFAMGWIYIYINSVVMGYYSQLQEAGWYNAAYKILGAFVLSAALISRSFYPALNRLFGKSKENFLEILRNQMQIMSVLAVAMVIGGLFLAKDIIYFLYGQAYIQSVPIFKVLLFVCIIDFFYYPFASVVVISEKQNKVFYNMVFGVILNTVLSLILVPKYSYYGASFAALASSVTIFLAIFIQAYRTGFLGVFNKNFAKFLFVYILSGLIMGVLVKAGSMLHINVLLLIFSGMIIYFGILSLVYIKLLKLTFRKLKSI